MRMRYRVTFAEALPGHRLALRFADGVEGEVDVSDLVGQGVFKAWEDPADFARVFVDEESGTVTWPNGADLAPGALYREIAGAPTP
jgi:hypothetical protein